MDTQLKKHLQSFLSPQRESRLREVLAQRTEKIHVVLEDLANPHNSMAIVRTLDCFGVQNIHLIENEWSFERHDKGDKGAGKWVDFHRYNAFENNTKPCLDELKKQGFKIVATTPHTSKELADITFNQPIALVFGNETHGISEEMKQEADELVKLPMYGFTESFNISVSVALSLYELTQKMRQELKDWQIPLNKREKLYEKWLPEAVNHSDALIKRYWEDAIQIEK